MSFVLEAIEVLAQFRVEHAGGQFSISNRPPNAVVTG
jgi:hypothetical protein